MGHPPSVTSKIFLLGAAFWKRDKSKGFTYWCSVKFAFLFSAKVLTWCQRQNRSMLLNAGSTKLKLSYSTDDNAKAKAAFMDYGFLGQLCTNNLLWRAVGLLLVLKKIHSHSKIDSKQTSKIKISVCSVFPHCNLKMNISRNQHNFPPYCTESNLSAAAFNWTHVIEDCACGLSRQSSFPPTPRDGKMIQREKEWKNRD